MIYLKIISKPYVNYNQKSEQERRYHLEFIKTYQNKIIKEKRKENLR